jgi:hypothetical protein
MFALLNGVDPIRATIISVQTTAMIRRHATAEDFQRWEDAARAMTTDCLLYSAKDCRKVEALWRGVDGMVEGFYSDQASTYAMELRRRQMG